MQQCQSWYIGYISIGQGLYRTETKWSATQGLHKDHTANILAMWVHSVRLYDVSVCFNSTNGNFRADMMLSTDCVCIVVCDISAAWSICVNSSRIVNWCVTWTWYCFRGICFAYWVLHKCQCCSAFDLIREVTGGSGWWALCTQTIIWLRVDCKNTTQQLSRLNQLV